MGSTCRSTKHNGTLIQGRGFLEDDRTDHALRFIEANKDWPDRMIFSHWVGKTSVRTQRYRLDNAKRLFDMETDPGQDHAPVIAVFETGAGS